MSKSEIFLINGTEQLKYLRKYDLSKSLYSHLGPI